MIYHSVPQCRVSFFPQSPSRTGSLTVSSTVSDAATWRQDSLLAVTTRKDVGEAAGHFSVVMTPVAPDGTYWRDTLRVGDLVLIELGPDAPQPDLAFTPPTGWPVGLEPVLLGSVDEVRESFTMGQDGQPQRTVTALGRDMAKYLVDDQIWWDAWSDVEHVTNGLFEQVDQWLKSGTSGAKASGMIQFFLTFLASHYDVHFQIGGDAVTGLSGTLPFYAGLLASFMTQNTPVIGAPQTWEAAQGAPWALMARGAAPPFGVLVYDMRTRWDLQWMMGVSREPFLQNLNKPRWNTPNGQFDSLPTLMFYRNPWSNRDYDDWTSWPTRVVRERDLIQSNLGRSAAEVTNTWRVRADVQGPFRPQESGSVIDARDTRDFVSIRRYGERPLLIPAPFVQGKRDSALLDLLRQVTFRLKDWNRWNEHFLSGSLTFKGMAAIRVGDRLWYWDHQTGDPTPGGFQGGIDFYVEAVSQEFVSFSHWTTTVEVTRGQRHREPGQALDFSDVRTGVPVGAPGGLPRIDATTDNQDLLDLELFAQQVRPQPVRP